MATVSVIPYSWRGRVPVSSPKRRWWSGPRLWANQVWRSRQGVVSSGVRARIMRIGAAKRLACVAPSSLAMSIHWLAEKVAVRATDAPTLIAGAKQ